MRIVGVQAANVDEIVTVTEEEIANGILVLLESEKTVVEGSGATAVAACFNGKVAGIAADMGPLAVGEPGDTVARPDMDRVVGHLVGELGAH